MNGNSLRRRRDACESKGMESFASERLWRFGSSANEPKKRDAVDVVANEVSGRVFHAIG